MAIQIIPCPEFHNLYFVGRNYIQHVEELANDRPEHPLIFTKPVSCASLSSSVPYPSHTKELHFEGEMVFVLPGSLKIYHSENEILVGCGIDFTARDIQTIIKGKGWPWFEAKCFRGSAVLSSQFVLIPVNQLEKLCIETWINGQRRQVGYYSQTLFSLPDLIRHLDSLVEIEANDILFTGTPEGVGTVQTGDRIEVCLLFDGSELMKTVCEVS